MSTSTRSGSGNTLTVNWDVRFKFTWDDENSNIYLYVIDDDNANSGWVDSGDWTTENDLELYNVGIDDATPDPGQ
ncbi:MAG: hypothetical protein R6U78_17450, partial [Bacteroidales bacterium]